MKAQKFTKNYPLNKHLLNLLMMAVGSCISIAGLTIFITPNGLLSAGAWGVAIIIGHFVSSVPMGIWVAIINIPLLIWGWKKMHLRFALYTVYNIILQTVLLLVAPDILPVYTENRLLACLFGGALIGLGSGLLVRYHGSAGGSDIVGLILNSKFDVSVGAVTMTINGLIVLCGAFIFGFEPALYTLVQLFVFSMVFNNVLDGFNSKRNMMIVTDKGSEIALRLMRDVGRGVTIVKGEGGYTHMQKDVLFCVLSRFELSAVKEIIREIDEKAFVCINQTYDVMGAFPRRGLTNELRRQAIAETGEDMPPLNN